PTRFLFLLFFALPAIASAAEPMVVADATPLPPHFMSLASVRAKVPASSLMVRPAATASIMRPVNPAPDAAADQAALPKGFIPLGYIHTLHPLPMQHALNLGSGAAVHTVAPQAAPLPVAVAKPAAKPAESDEDEDEESDEDNSSSALDVLHGSEHDMA